jgi:DNA-binding GntR family transcriptional regulator
MDDAARADDEGEFMHHDQWLHSLVLEAAGNRRARRLVDGLRDATRLLGASTVGTSRSLHDIAAEHEPLVAAIEVGDADAAGRAMAAHVEHTARLLRAQAVGAAPEGGRVAELWTTVTD